jgi:diadenosine tetraphosphate (Ap4A) HIT family hydrolase
VAEGDADDQATGCFICEKHRYGDAAEGGVLYEDELVYAGHVHTMGQQSAYRGWLVVEPKRHAAALGELTDAEASALGVLVNRLARILKEATRSTSTRLCSATP